MAGSIHRAVAGLCVMLAGVVCAQENSDPGWAPAPVGAPALPETAELTAIAIATPAPSAASSAPGGAEPRQIEEIVVTAQKTKQSLQKVPISVTAIAGDFVRESGAADLADIALYVPNVRVDTDDLGSPQLFIRGFGTNAFNPSFEGSVGFVQDELFYGRPGYFTESMFDIDRIEVLRGPQGTLFGKNTIAGVFNVATAAPEGEFRTSARYSYGEHRAHRLEGAAGGDIGDWGGARVAGLYRREDGELYNQFLRRDEERLEQKAGRVRIRAYPALDVQTELLLQTSATEAAFWPFQLFRLDDDTRAYLETFDPDIEDDPYDFRTSFDTPGFIEKGSDTAALHTTWQIGALGGLQDLESVLMLGYSTFYIDQLNELDVSPADISRLDSHEDHRQLTAELRFSGRADSLFGLGDEVEFVAGVFYYRSRYGLLARVLAGADLGSYVLTADSRQLAGCGLEGAEPLRPLLCADGSGVPGAPLIGELLSPLAGEDEYRFDYTQDVDAIALFGQATWYLNERWAVTPGLRLNRERKRVDAAGNSHCRQKDTADNPLLASPCAMELLLQADNYSAPGLTRTEYDVSPKFTLQYFAGRDVSIYASYARGFKSGGFNAISFSGEDLEYEPEKAQTAELGFKGQFLARTLRFNATLYATQFDNLQVLAFNGVFFDVSNAAAARSKGLEADLLWLTPWAPLSVMGSVGLLDARYDEYRAAPAPVRNPQTGELQVGATQDLSGGRIAFAPRATATLTPMVQVPIGSVMAKLAFDLIYQGDQYTDTDLDPDTRVDPHTLYAARVIVADTLERWSLTLGGSNLTDERVLNQVTDAVFFPGTYFAQQAGGRQLFAAVSVQF